MRPFLAFIAFLLSLQSTCTSAESSQPDAQSWHQPIPEQLQQFIAQFNSPHPETQPQEAQRQEPQPHPHLQKRQRGVGGPNEPAPTTTIATQMSPVTTYMVNGKPVVFTQTFAPTPDPWSGPVQGTIGLGTIQGVVGTVRSG